MERQHNSNDHIISGAHCEPSQVSFTCAGRAMRGKNSTQAASKVVFPNESLTTWRAAPDIYSPASWNLGVAVMVLCLSA
eukprot:scaffold274708_cov44-Prasinocladus_malaysianus.AAC.1